MFVYNPRREGDGYVAIIKQSFIWRICLFIAALYRGSLLSRVWDSVAEAWTRMWRSSFIGPAFIGERRLVSDWGESLLCIALTWLINLPAMLLYKLRGLTPRFWEGSVTLRFASWLGENAVVLISWSVLAILCIPYKRWDNTYSLILMLMVTAFIFLYGMKGRSRVLDVSGAGFYASAFACLVILSFISSDSMSLSFRWLFFHLSCMLAVLSIVSRVRSREDLMRLMLFVSLGIIAASISAVLQRRAGVEVNKSWVDLDVSGDTPGRITSFYDNPNAFGMLLVMFLPAAASVFFAGRGWRRAVGALSFVLGAAALALTYSRGPWLGFAFSVVLMVALLRPKLLPLFLLACLLIVPFLPGTVYSRAKTIFNFSDSSTLSRLPIWKASVDLIKLRPFGVGLGADTVFDAIYANNLYINKATFIHAHNIYLQISAEAGVFAAFVFFCTVMGAIKAGIRTIWKKAKGDSLRTMTGGCVSGLAGVLLCGLIDYPWSYPRIMFLFWVAFALLASSVKLCKAEEAGKALI